MINRWLFWGRSSSSFSPIYILFSISLRFLLGHLVHNYCSVSIAACIVVNLNDRYFVGPPIFKECHVKKSGKKYRKHTILRHIDRQTTHISPICLENNQNICDYVKDTRQYDSSVVTLRPYFPYKYNNTYTKD